MVMYIDPTMNAAGFGDVQNAMLTLDADATEQSTGGGPSFPPALSLVPPSGTPIVAAKLPSWLIVAAFVAFLLLVNDRRTR